MLVRKRSKNRITLPKTIVRQLPDAEYFEVTLRQGEIILKPIGSGVPGEPLKAVRAKIKALGVVQKDVQRAVRWVRRRVKTRL